MALSARIVARQTHILVGNSLNSMWKYEPDENPKIKHHWDKLTAGFVEINGARIGKCPSNMALSLAEDLLNNGIPFSPPGWNRPYPKRIYAVHDGVVYRATHTRPGVSYHGFPEYPSEIRTLPGPVRDAILQEARTLGCEKEVKRWINQ